ncbi:uncharacterized protein SCHCODRAFT_02664354 [Schizophyllum commune H4-8]|nr:uncharacterized protein SCHCODRAFT_02664354 [Schizophyllum commune H4-8]KAI5896556.1 hypothetical protein SCHCODRAFT_02664354 [Schizophyllum commune H4-8]
MSNSPTVHSSSRYQASSSENVGPARRTTYASQGSRQRRASLATAPPSQPSQLRPTQQQHSSSNHIHTANSPRSTRAARSSHVPQPFTAVRSERTPAAPVASTQPPASRQQQGTTTSELSPPVKAALDGEGGVLVDQDFTIDRTTGICSVSLMSSWETVRRIAVTRPITVSDLYQVLQRATNLEYAYFECIIQDAQPSDIYGTEFTAKHLKSLIIACAEVPVSAIFHDLRVKRLEALQVRYAPGGGYNLWSDEVYLALFLQRAQLAKDGAICIASNETWYRDQRAAALLSSLKVAVGRASQQWRIFVT